MLHCRHL